MSDSDSSLSSPPATDDEMPEVLQTTKPAKAPQKKRKKNGTILSYLKSPEPSPPRKKRPASPERQVVFEDNPDVAFIVMFRSRFQDAFPPKCPHFGPQDIEKGVSDALPSPQIESLLCALLGLVNNRKKPVEKGHYGRALEEAIQTQKSQWPRSWNGVNPLSGGRSFNTMSREERISLLKALVLWSLNNSEYVNHTIKETYKSRNNRDKNDVNIPLSVQPWGRDGDKRRYWLVEGQDDTSFRVYREGDTTKKKVPWFSVAGSIEEIRALAQKLLDDDGTREAKALSERMLNAVPRFEATEEKRKKREYRQIQKARFTRPEPGFSLYEGRTRGKRMKYTFSEEEDVGSDGGSVRRSMRQSGRTSPVETGPTVTASGRQVRSRATGMYGESLLSGQTTERASPATGDYVRSDVSEEPQPQHGRSTRAAAKATTNGWSKGRKHIETYNSVDEMDDEDVTSWDGGDDDDEPDQMDLDEGEDGSGEQSSDEELEPKSLVVRLKYKQKDYARSPPPFGAPQERDPPTIVSKPQPDLHPTGPLAPGPPPSPAFKQDAPAQPVNIPQPIANATPHSIAAPQSPLVAVPIVPTSYAPPAGPPATVMSETVPQESSYVQPPTKRDVPSSAPTPPYAVSEGPAYGASFPVALPETKPPLPVMQPEPKPQKPAAQPEPEPQFPATQSGPPSQCPPPSAPNPTLASDWQ